MSAVFAVTTVSPGLWVMCHVFFFSSRRRHTRCSRDWSSDVCSSDLADLYLFGTNLDPATGSAVSSGPIRINNSNMPGRQTTRIDYGANLPKAPVTTAG